jgi:hypothetical protein
MCVKVGPEFKMDAFLLDILLLSGHALKGSIERPMVNVVIDNYSKVILYWAFKEEGPK